MTCLNKLMLNLFLIKVKLSRGYIWNLGGTQRDRLLLWKKHHFNKQQQLFFYTLYRNMFYHKFCRTPAEWPRSPLRPSCVSKNIRANQNSCSLADYQTRAESSLSLFLQEKSSKRWVWISIIHLSLLKEQVWSAQRWWPHLFSSVLSAK